MEIQIESLPDLQGQDDSNQSIDAFNSTNRIWPRSLRHLGAWTFVALFLAIAVGYIFHTHAATTRASTRLVIYAFSTQEETFTQGIFPAFKRQWRSQTGIDLSIEAIFGPSGTLAGQINLGAPADIAVFSNARHVHLLKMGRMVKRDTQCRSIGSSPIVIVTRSGNPFNITSFTDLTQPGLRLLHQDPRGSGAGEWALLAEYGSSFLETGSQDQAEEQLNRIWDNVRLLAPSARGALTLFELGAGDAFLTYEQDARLALERGVPLEIVIPTRTVLAQSVVVGVDRNVSRAERPVVEAFIEYLMSDSGQATLQRYHWRTVTGQAQGYPPLISPFTVEDLGGWSHAYTDLVDLLWKSEIQPQLNLEPGVTILGQP